MEKIIKLIGAITLTCFFIVGTSDVCASVGPINADDTYTVGPDGCVK